MDEPRLVLPQPDSPTTAQRFACQQCKVYAIDSPHSTLGGKVMHLQVLNVQ